MLLGTHGTCQSRAQSIVTNMNFNAPSRSGSYAGPGAYFWQYEGSVDLAKELAELWWEWCSRKNHYSNDSDKTLAVIGVELHNPSDDEFIDTYSDQFSSRLRELVKEFEGKVEFNVHEVIAMAIDDLAVERGTRILLVKTWVKTPPALGGRPVSVVLKAYTGWPCFVVRDGGERLISSITTIQ